MTDIKPIKDAADLFQRINRSAHDADWTDAELRDVLVSEGISPAEFLNVATAEVKRLLRESEFHWRSRANTLRSKIQESMAAAERRRSERLPRNLLLDNIEAALARMPPTMKEQFALEHRNFEKCTDDDLESILIDIECLAGLDDSDATK